MFKPSSSFLTDRFEAVLLLWILFRVIDTVTCVSGQVCQPAIEIVCIMYQLPLISAAFVHVYLIYVAYLIVDIFIKSL